MKRFEAHPHRMWRIRKSAVRKRVSHKEIAEFVVNARNGNGKAWEKCDTDGDHCKKKQKSRKESSERKWRDDFRSQARDSLARLRENELQCKKRTRGDQGVIKSSDQRLQVRRIGADHCEHAEDNTGEGARTKTIRG